jgi:hypothetical protein
VFEHCHELTQLGRHPIVAQGRSRRRKEQLVGLDAKDVAQPEERRQARRHQPALKPAIDLVADPNAFGHLRLVKPEPGASRACALTEDGFWSGRHGQEPEGPPE